MKRTNGYVRKTVFLLILLEEVDVVELERNYCCKRSTIQLRSPPTVRTTNSAWYAFTCVT